jgi:osmotically-inducible protein OsmY
MNGKLQHYGIVFVLILSTLALLVSPGPARAADKQKTNEAMKTVIEDRLEKDSITTVQVSVANDTVTLTGMVNSVADEKKAVDEAHNVANTYDIIDKLTVKPMTMSDVDLAEAVANSIKHNVYYSVFDWIVVNADNGVVTLSGYAAEPWRKEDYLHQAEKVNGVKEVVDNIKLLPTSVFDDQIRRQARNAIYDNPMFEQWASTLNPPIHIVVDNGNIILFGYVRSEVEKRVAGNLAAFNSNAFHVDNRLVIQSP